GAAELGVIRDAIEQPRARALTRHDEHADRIERRHARAVGEQQIPRVALAIVRRALAVRGDAELDARVDAARGEANALGKIRRFSGAEEPRVLPAQREIGPGSALLDEPLERLPERPRRAPAGLTVGALALANFAANVLVRRGGLAPITAARGAKHQYQSGQTR